METIGFIGLGHMGTGMAENLLKAGYPMVVYDIREEATRLFLERGARLAQSPASVARLSNVIFTSLPTPKEVEEVAIGRGGIIEGIEKGSIYADLTTSRPSLIRRIEPMFRQKGAYAFDTPVLGGPSGSKKRCSAVLVGGDPVVYERIKPILGVFAKTIIYCGAIGAGLVCKLVHNGIGHGMRQAIAEGFTLGVKAGVNPLVLWESVRRGGRGTGRDLLMLRTLRGDFEYKRSADGFSLVLSRKDLGLFTELGRECNVPMPVANLAEQITIQAMNRGWGDKNSNVTIRIQEELAGVEMRAPDADPEKTPGFVTTDPDS